MTQTASWKVTATAILAGPAAAFVVSFPAIILGAAVASNWLPGSFYPAELALAIPVLAALAAVLGLPGGFLGAFLGGRSGSRRAWHPWVIAPVGGAAFSGGVALCLSGGPSLAPEVFIIVFGLTISGFFSGLASRTVTWSSVSFL